MYEWSNATHELAGLLRAGFIILIAAQVLAVMAAPCTLYKPGDIENARENVKRYPWATSIVDSWKRSVDYAMQQDEQWYDEMITPQTNWTEFGQNCPACVGKQSSMGECGLYKWSITDPDKLTCKYCGTVYPNAEYPETGSMTCPTMGQTFTYYETPEERAHPDENPSPYAFKWAHWPIHTSFSGIIRSKKSHWCANQIFTLAKLYAVTGEVQYAEKCAMILNRFAEVYPEWLFFTYNGTYADCPPAEAAANMGKNPRNGRFPKEVIIDPFERHQKADHAELCVGFWGAGRFDSSGCHAYHLHWTVAYDLIREAKRADGSPVITPEMDKRIVNDLLLAACNDMENWADINNKCGPGRALSAACSLLFERPESARRALDGFSQLMDECFHEDGFCMESPSYSGMHLGLMRQIPELLRGYTDPAGYTDDNGERFDNLQPFEYLTRYKLALASMVKMAAPEKRVPVIGDTHYKNSISSDYVEILTDRYSSHYAPLLETLMGDLATHGNEYALWYRDPDLNPDKEAALPLQSEWFPGWHVGVLRTDKPMGDNALYLNGYAYHGHRHHDTLGLIYYAFGKEIASDRGYIWDDPRNAWTRSTLSHNIVTVDGTDQKAGGPAALELFGVSPGIEVIQASAPNAYEQCDVYRRTSALVQLPNDVTYAVDFFRVAGGKLHQYGFQCNGNLVDLTAPTPEATGDEIKWLSNLRASTPQGPFTATWQDEDIFMDLHVINPIDRLLVTDAPGWRSDKGSELNAPPIQQIFAEHSDGEYAQSNYAAVMVPHNGASPVTKAWLIQPDDAPDAMAAVVELNNRVDYIISCPGGGIHEYGPVTFDGAFGFVSLSHDGKVLQAYVLDGAELTCADVTLTLNSAREDFGVERVDGQTIYLDRAVPADLAIEGAYVLAGDTGYEVASADDNSITVRDYPVIECDNISVINSAWLSMK